MRKCLVSTCLTWIGLLFDSTRTQLHRRKKRFDKRFSGYASDVFSPCLVLSLTLDISSADIGQASERVRWHAEEFQAVNLPLPSYPSPQLCPVYPTDQLTHAANRSAGCPCWITLACAISAVQCRDCKCSDRNFCGGWLRWLLAGWPRFLLSQTGHDRPISRESCFALVFAHNAPPACAIKIDANYLLAKAILLCSRIYCENVVLRQQWTSTMELSIVNQPTNRKSI